jgi:hypothetical protein
MAESVGLKLGIYRCEWLWEIEQRERMRLFGKGQGVLSGKVGVEFMDVIRVLSCFFYT